MNFQFDLSLNTIFVSGVVAVVGWLLKEGISALIHKLIENAAATAITNKMIEQLTDRVGDHEKLRRDINNYFEMYRRLEAKFEKYKSEHP